MIAGKYRLETALARGGMGSVWQAKHLTLDMRLAVKFIKANIVRNNEARVRFEREAKAAARLKSPHVVQVVDYGVDQDMPYLVMELLQGEDLSNRLARRGRLGVRETVGLVTHVGRALARAGAEQIVHRDLKPSNIFIARGDDHEIIKVLDFGVARVPQPEGHHDTTVNGALVGSPRYMSPEQARGSRAVDHRSDLWSLAVIVYRALTGELPFEGKDMADVIVKICSETALPPSQRRADLAKLGPAMDGFFVRAFARDPNERFQTARELVHAFTLAAGYALPAPASATPTRSVPKSTRRLPATTTPPAKAPPDSDEAPPTQRSAPAASRPQIPRPEAHPQPREADVRCAVEEPRISRVSVSRVSLPRASVSRMSMPRASVPAPMERREPMPSSLRASVDDIPPTPRVAAWVAPLRHAFIGGAIVAAAACALHVTAVTGPRSNASTVAAPSPAAAVGAGEQLPAPSARAAETVVQSEGAAAPASAKPEAPLPPEVTRAVETARPVAPPAPSNRSRGSFPQHGSPKKPMKRNVALGL
ncbi:MAG: protein kinase [Minicystis sp.]